MDANDFLERPLNELLEGLEKSTVVMLALGIDERGTGAVVRFDRKDAPPARYFLPSPAAFDFARDLVGNSEKLGYDASRVAEFATFGASDWSHDETKLVRAIRMSAFPKGIILGLLLETGPEFHGVSGDLATALAADILDEFRKGRLIDLRSACETRLQ